MKKSWMGQVLPPPLPLLLLLLLAAGAAAQSGDSGESGDATDAALESRISCWSHITTNESSLTCQLAAAAAGGEDDEDHDAVDQMSICFRSVGRQGEQCLHVRGNTITDKQLHPVVPLKVYIQLRSQRRVCKTLDLKKIVRPRAPRVQNVTFSRASNQVLFHIGTPYQDQYLRSDNQLFQLHIWTSNKSVVQNTSSQTMSVDLEHLRRHARYNVRVRSIPVHFLGGSWSSWSAAFGFSTPRGPGVHTHSPNSHKLTACVIVLTLLTLGFVVFKKNKIFSYVWPSIPSPKPALVQICRPSKALLLHFKPDEFSALKIDPRDAAEKMEGGPTAAVAPDPGSAAPDPGSAPGSGCSASTEELELSALLSGSEGLSGSAPAPAPTPGDHPDPPREREAEAGPGPGPGPGPSPGPGPGPSPGPSPPPALAAGKMEEAYVTMSSFYQIK